MILKGRRNKKEAVKKLISDNILYVSVVVNYMLTDNMTRSHIDTYCIYIHAQACAHWFVCMLRSGCAHMYVKVQS